MQHIRGAVKENILSDPSRITYEDYVRFLTTNGKGFVYADNDVITGFAIVDLHSKNVWALFVHPDYEKRGHGKILHDTMLDWFFKQTTESIWLTTSPGTRAEKFYRKAGWTENGIKNGEILFTRSHR